MRITRRKTDSGLWVSNFECSITVEDFIRSYVYVCCKSNKHNVWEMVQDIEVVTRDQITNRK